MTAQPDPDKLARLKAALEDFAEGHAPLIDEEQDKAETKIREQALRLLDQRGRSRAELKQRLIRKNQLKEPASGSTEPVERTVDEVELNDLIDRVLDSLESNGLINDAVFAHEWVRQRSEHKGKSSRALDQELRAKGVESQIRLEALSQLSEEDEEDTARAFAHKKARVVKTPPADRTEYEKYLRRIVGVLARRGYPSGVSMRIAREELDARIGTLVRTSQEERFRGSI